MPTSPETRPINAVLWMLGATASFSLMAVAGREISAELDTFELMLYRSAIGLGVIVAVMAATGRSAEVRTPHFRLHATRNSIHFIAQNCWFYGIAVIPMAQLVALEFTNPIWVALLAPLLLGEAMTARRALAVGLGFIGILIVARPGLTPLGPGHAAALVSALGFAITNIVTKQITGRDSILCLLFWMTAFQTVFSIPLALPGGVTWPSTGLWPWVVVVSLTGLSAHLCLTSALAAAPATFVAPLEFLRLPVIAMIGTLFYAEAFEIAVVIGAAVIVVANFVNLSAPRRARIAP